MVYVLFEAEVAEGRQDDYLARAASLKESLANAHGFVRSERFESLAQPGKLLSLSVWESEEAVAAWRNLDLHRQCQEAGREGVFKDYSITVLSPVQRSYGMEFRENAPADSNIRFGLAKSDPPFSPEQHALLFADLCAAVEDARPDDSEGFLIDATKTYAVSRAARMRARAQKAGLPLDAKTYQSYSEIPSPLEGSRKETGDRSDGVETTTFACPWFDAWFNAGLLDYGKIFCAHFDAALADAFGAPMEVPCTLTQGADHCTFLFPEVHFSEEDFADIAKRNAELNGSATEPFDYHCAHLLHVFKECVVEAYGKEAGEQMVASALQSFGEQFGDSSADHVTLMEAEITW